MKKLLLLVLFSSLVLAGCAQQGLSQSELFEKKESCTSHTEEMLKQALEITSVHGIYAIDEIFYSQKDNTCYYVALWTEWKLLFNYLNRALVDSYVYLEDQKRFEQKIKELKWE